MKKLTQAMMIALILSIMSAPVVAQTASVTLNDVETQMDVMTQEELDEVRAAGPLGIGLVILGVASAVSVATGGGMIGPGLTDPVNPVAPPGPNIHTPF
ncbi:MAG: hypothetical protein LAT62_00770 [Natronospirillum sp.]|uniref:hypothetical protein n=1 Tax=Natronospirillum sp. TaxID=2812955 RepID=UPI0025E559BE|nr:hypothetical protein [Natronospirillum sp.]MCH8550435.1 hypothetical protein [Natronospirillum sp.]